jgi:NTE family protein
VAGVLPIELQEEGWEDVDIGGLLLEFRHDSLDSLWFPSRGTFHRIGYRYASEALGASEDYHQFGAVGGFAYTASKNTFLVNYELGYSVDDKAPIERWFELGGLGRLSGLVPDQLSGRQLGLVTLAYHRRLNEIDLLPAYAGISLEAGNVWNHSDDVSFGDLRLSGSIFVGARTPLGPIYVAWGYSDNGESTFYFYLGNPFRLGQF